MPSLPIPLDHRDFTPERQALFLTQLADWGNVRAASKAAGVSHTAAYRMRRANMEFAELWDGALLIARAQAEEVLADRALNGVEEQVFYHGEEVARRKRFDGRLLLAHLGRLDKLAHKTSARDAAIGFDRRVECLARGEDEDEEDFDWEEEFSEGRGDDCDDGREDACEDS